MNLQSFTSTVQEELRQKLANVPVLTNTQLESTQLAVILIERLNSIKFTSGTYYGTLIQYGIDPNAECNKELVHKAISLDIQPLPGVSAKWLITKYIRGHFN